MVPVFFGLMGFAIDLGQLYAMRSELKAAANSMALAAAAKLTGTEAALDGATAAARLTIETTSGYGNKYGFGAFPIGETTGNLSSEVSDPTYYAAVVDAIGDSSASTGGEVGGAQAKHARVTIRADAPLLFWSFLSLAQERKISLQVQSVAGQSAPLCAACGIEPLAIAAPDSSDTEGFGLTVNQRYTLYYSCQAGGLNRPGPLGGAPLLAYLLLNRYNPNATLYPDEQQQAYRNGAQGMPPIPGGAWSDTLAYACVRIATTGAGENVWATATPGSCGQVTPTVTSALCGLDSRFESAAPSACSTITDVDTLLSLYTQDTDLNDLDDYTTYAGNGRRIITVPIVDALNPAGGMLVLGFREFLVEPYPGATNLTPSDQLGRFVALYIGSVVPVRQGLAGGCPQQAAGPGKVVLHQ